MDNVENAVSIDTIFDFDQSFDTEAFEKFLEEDIASDVADLNFLEESKNKIGDEENLKDSIINIVWEQFRAQAGINAGDEFIQNNNGLTLDLRKSAHIQTTENFAKGKIATHNTKIDYQKRYDDYYSQFEKDSNGNIKTHKTRAGKEEATLKKGARKRFDANRPSGSKERGTDMDHTVSAGEIMRDPQANAHLSREEQEKFANSKKNLNEMDSSLNRSKGDTSMEDWLNNPNSKGQKPREVHNLSEEDEKKLRKKDKEAREEYDRVKAEGERRSIETGKESRKEEALRISKTALKSVLLSLLMDFLREIITKVVLWFKEKNKSLKSFVANLKNSIFDFIRDLKSKLFNSVKTLTLTLLESIFGNVIKIIQKIFSALGKSIDLIKKVFSYLKDPENKKKSYDIILLEIGKIVIGSLTAIGAVSLGSALEVALSSIPGFLIPIPFFGSIASILGIFLGGIFSGIIGFFAMRKVNGIIAKKQEQNLRIQKIEKGNEILNKQEVLLQVQEHNLKNTIESTNSNINERHALANKEFEKTLENIFDNDEIDHTDQFDEMNDLLDNL